MQKRWILGLIGTVLALPLAHASLGGRIEDIFQDIIAIGSLNFLGVPNGNMLIMFTRLLIGLLVFTIIFALATSLGGSGKQLEFLKRNHAIVLSACIALITTIFLPVEVLLAAGGGLGLLVGFGLIAGPMLAIVLIILKVPPKGEVDTRATYFIKFLLCCLLLWILTAMGHYIPLVG